MIPKAESIFEAHLKQLEKDTLEKDTKEANDDNSSTE